MTINGPSEKNLNVSLLETQKDFPIYPSFLRPETTEDEIQRLSFSEKTKQLALSSFPGSQSSSSSSSSLKGSAPTIFNSPIFSPSADLFGERIEPLIPDYLPGFFLGNKGRFEAESLSLSNSISEEKAHTRNTKKRSASLQIDKGTEPIKVGTEAFEKVLQEASEHRRLAPTFRDYRARLKNSSDQPMLLSDFEKRVKDWKKH